MSTIDYRVADGLCVLRLAAPPVNAISLPLLDDLRQAVLRANADPEVRGLLVVGDARHFSAGADVKLFRAVESPEEAVRISRVFQEAFQEVENSAKPVAAAVAGKVTGSALELAASCHLRVCAAGTTFRMPEVTLGINPGAGGTQRLPRLVGVTHALRMLLGAEIVGADEAQGLGLVDAVCEADALEETARRLLAEAGAPARTRDRSDRVADVDANAATFAEAEKRLAAVRPEIVAPRQIAEAVRAGLDNSFEAGLAAEQQAFAACMKTSATRNLIYLFFATRDTAKAPDLGDARPAPVRKAAVVGMGSMGSGIVQALTRAGLPVLAVDADPAALERGLGRIRASLEKRVQAGKLSPERAEATLGLVCTANDCAEAADADVVVEAVFEDVGVKRGVLAALEAACGPETLLATNTSTISLDTLAEGMQRSERLVGMHFFNPAHSMPLVEVIRRDTTAPQAIATALALVRAARKTPVLVRNREGFLVNRIFLPYMTEAFHLLEEGAEAPAVDRAMTDFGFPMGPFVLIDMAGIDILVKTDDVMCKAFPRHGRLSRVARRLVAEGHHGQKTGAGVYRYEKGRRRPLPSDATAAALGAVRCGTGRPARAIDAGEITERLALRMVAEAFHVLAEGIAQRESDIDAATVLGLGFPGFRGGVLRYARDLGKAAVRSRLEALETRFGARFALPGPFQHDKGE